ncbi:MAG TPA: hypothetical protein VKB80_08260 [Kofleriaceae bacterium]|nr:hypothetical protein [Kofleriaceae bacterium]
MRLLSPLLALAGVLAAASACSLRYDPDDLGQGDDESGGGDQTPDAGPDDLFVHRVFPSEVFEGEGFAADPDDQTTVRAIPMVLFGQNMTPDTRVTVSGDGFLLREVEAQVSPDGAWAAFELRMPLVEDSSEARDVELRISLVKGAEMHETTVVHHLLPELAPVPQTPGGTVTLSPDSLKVDSAGVARFSRVDLRGNVLAGQGGPLRLFAYAGISVTGVLNASGNGAEPGAGGCAGGDVGLNAACGDGSGGAGASAAVGVGGGGGGGFGTEGRTGLGDAKGGGDPGEATGDPSLVPMPPSGGGVRPAGGGGGGKGALDAGGTPGGGSGGVIELTTPGLFSLSAAVQVDGAAGTDCPSLDPGGAGGGGSGGALMLRAGSLVVGSGGATLEAVGGRGGTCSAGDGGKGGAGRIRLDLPAAGAITADPPAFVGPAFVMSEIPVVTTDSALPVEIRGEPGGSYQLLVISPDTATDDERTRTEAVATPGPDGVGEKTVELSQGFNRLCLRVVPDADPDSQPEAANCLNVAYISR